MIKTMATAARAMTICIVATLGFNAADAFAGSPSNDPSTVSVTVKSADLNISNPSGALVLYNRIRAAAESGCSYYWFERDADQVRCVHDAIANAVTKVNRPALFAVYNANNKKPLPTALLSQSR